MPLPPRDMTAVHLSMNPALAALHQLYPLSRFMPVLGAFKLSHMIHNNHALPAMLDATAWLTLACLDDGGADYVLSCAVAAAVAGNTKARVNATIAQAAAPFLVPMLIPTPPPLLNPKDAVLDAAPRILQRTRANGREGN